MSGGERATSRLRRRVQGSRRDTTKRTPPLVVLGLNPIAYRMWLATACVFHASRDETAGASPWSLIPARVGPDRGNASVPASAERGRWGGSGLWAPPPAAPGRRRRRP